MSSNHHNQSLGSTDQSLPQSMLLAPKKKKNRKRNAKKHHHQSETNVDPAIFPTSDKEASARRGKSNALDPEYWSGSLVNTDNHLIAEIQLSDIPGYSRQLNDLEHFLKNCEGQAGERMAMVDAYLNLSVLSMFFNPSVSLFQVRPLEQASMVAFGKLRNFLNVNSVAAVIRTAAEPSCILCILPYSEEVSGVWNIERWTIQNLVAMYIQTIPIMPTMLSYPDDYIYKDQLMEDPDKLYTWQLLTLTLKFPGELLRRIEPTTHIEVYGDSKWAVGLRKAYEVFAVKPPLKSKGRVFLFDRHNDMRFKIDLSKYKRSLWPVTFWEFGVSSVSSPVFVTPAQIFPPYKGGYVTTDVANIIDDPMILLRISDAVRELNTNAAGGEWNFVLYDDILNRLEAAITDPRTAKQIYLALLILKLILQQDGCHIWRDWSTERNDASYDQSISTVEFMEKLLRKFCYSAESFVLVDDINSMPEYLPVIERHRSNLLLNKLSMFPAKQKYSSNSRVGLIAR